MELIQGVLNKQELFQIKKFLKVFEIQILDITSKITHIAMEKVE